MDRLRFALLCSVCFAAGPAPRLTLAVAGPYHVEGSRIVDSAGRTYLVRGTEMPTLTLKTFDIAGDGKEFGAFSLSSFITIRQRLNMNAVRLPVSGPSYEESEAYRERVREVVRRANRFELLVILAAEGENDVRFWSRCADRFKANPNVFFAVSGDSVQSFIGAIRSAGANQPILAAGITGPVGDQNIIYEVTPRYATTRTDEDRRRQFGSLAEHVPVLARDLDPQLDLKSEECAAFPSDPGDATKLVEDNLAYFVTHHISWTLSSFRPGRMLTEYRFYNWSKLDEGWTCGESPSPSGIAMILLSHLWGGEPHGLFSVSPPTGGIVIARGAVSTLYGPILAERQMSASGRPLPFRLGNVSVRVGDSRGVSRAARLLYTGAGWANLTYVVPRDTAPGPAEVVLERTDGSRSTTKVIVADVAPGFWTATADGRGPAIGRVVQRFANGTSKVFSSWQCAKNTLNCGTVPIPLDDRVITTVRLDASGIRNAGPKADVRVMAGDVVLPVLSYGAADDAGLDQVTVKLPARLRGAGETDLFMTVEGVLSNVARINCGSTR